MIRITSLILLATSLVAFSSPLLPRTAAQVESDVSTLTTDLQNLDTIINELATEGILAVGALEEATATVLNELGTATTNAANTAQLDQADGQTLINSVQNNLEPITLKTLSDLDDNVAVIVKINSELKGVLQFVQQSLSNLSIATKTYANELTDIAPADLQPSASAIASTINAAFASAIAVYAAA